MISGIFRQISDTASGIKAAAATSAATVTTGSATWLEWIPSDIGKLATLVGLVLSSVLIYTHLQKLERDRERHEIEMAIKKKELES